MRIFKSFLKAYRASFANLPKAAWLLSMVVLVNRSGSMVLFFMSLYMTSELGFSVPEAGKIISIYGVGSLAGAFLGGWLSDRWGTSRVQVLSLFFSGIGYITLQFMSTFFSIGLTFFLLGVAAESFRPANATAVAFTSPPEVRARAFALNRLAVNLGITIGPALGGFLAMIHYSYLFWVDGISSIVAAIIFYFLFIRTADIDSTESSPGEDNGKSPLRDHIFLIILGLTFLIGMLFFQIFNTWPLFLRQSYNLLENQIGILLALNGFLIILLEMPLVHRFEKLNYMKIIAIGAVLIFGGFSILPLGNSFGFVLFTVFIWTLGEILIFPLMSAFIANRASDFNRGKYMGSYIFTYSFAFILGPALGSWVYATFGPVTLWSGAGAAGVFVFGGFLFVNRLILREAARPVHSSSRDDMRGSG
jgi:MFS family permease